MAEQRTVEETETKTNIAKSCRGEGVVQSHDPPHLERTRHIKKEREEKEEIEFIPLRSMLRINWYSLFCQLMTRSLSILTMAMSDNNGQN